MKGKKLLLLGATVTLCMGTVGPAPFTVANAIHAASTESESAVLDPSNLQDGTYEIQASVFKVGTTNASVSQSFFDKTATLTVKNGKITATIHLLKNKSLVSNLKLDADQSDLPITSTGDASEDIDIPINDLKNSTTIDMTIFKTMNEKADIGFDASTLKVIQLDEQPQSSASSESSSSIVENTTESSSSSSTTQESDSTIASESSTGPADNSDASTEDSSSTPTITIPTGSETDVPTTTPTNTTDDLITQAPLFDAASLVDGTYEVPYTVNKTNTNTPSLSNSFFSGNATVVVSDSGKNVTVTLHIIKNASFISAFTIGDQIAQISNKTASSSDLTFTVDDNFTSPTVQAGISVMNMNQKADIVFGTALFVPTENDSAEPSDSDEDSTTETTGNDTEQTNTDDTSTDSTGTDSSSDKTESSSSTSSESTSSTTSDSTSTSASDSSDSTDQTHSNTDSTVTPDQPTTSPTKTDDTNLTQAPLFNPNNLVDGTYQVPYTVNKVDSDDLSLATAYFSGNATIVVANNGTKETVTLHVTKFASLIKSFSIAGQAASISNQTSSTEDLTFNVDHNFNQARVTAQMSVLGMNQTANIVFGTALNTDKSTNTNDSTSEIPNTDNDQSSNNDENSNIPNSSSTSNDTEKSDHQITALIYQADAAGKLSDSPSSAQQFINKQVTVVKSGDGKTATITFHTTGASFINQMKLNDQVGTIKNKNGNEADIVFTVPISYLNTAQPAYFDLTIPGGVKMQQEAFVLLGINYDEASQQPTPTAQNTKSDSKASASTAEITPSYKEGIIDSNKDVQYVLYSVWDQSRSSLSTANNYYTHSAKVVKTGNGYDVYLTVQETAGFVNFTPISVKNIGIANYSKSTLGGNDIWQYSFHINNANELNNPVPAQIMMSVPIANISNQQFAIWLAFGKSESGGIDYMNSDSATALPATSIALATGNARTTIANAPTNANKLASATTKNGTQELAAADRRLPKLKDYPFIAEIAGFSAISIAIIGFAFFKKLH